MTQLNLWEPEFGATLALRETQTAPSPASEPGCRTLKIEEDGDFWRSRAKPKIRLVGRWLERAGFSPGGRVSVTCVAPGVIELRCPRCLNGE
jgi:hypothetical protein